MYSKNLNIRIIPHYVTSKFWLEKDAIKFLFDKGNNLENNIKNNKIESSSYIGKLLIYKDELKFLKITNNRLCKTSMMLDFTYIEIFEEDNIEDFFEIENIINNNDYEKEEIVVIQYPNGKKMEIKGGYIHDIGFQITHSAWTDKGSSGSPIILLRDFKVIGIHKSYSDYLKKNLGSDIKSIIENINQNYIISEYYIKNNDLGKEIKIFNDKYSESFEKYCNLKLNGKKINLCNRFKFEKIQKNKFEITFKQLIKDMFNTFNECSSLISLDLSNFNTINVIDMFIMFHGIKKNCNIITNDKNVKNQI